MGEEGKTGQKRKGVMKERKANQSKALEEAKLSRVVEGIGGVVREAVNDIVEEATAKVGDGGHRVLVEAVWT